MVYTKIYNMKKIVLFFVFITLVNISFAQDEKTVTLVVSGQGETQEDAKQNALRSAIEQAFGAFISSKPEILNVELVKDEIVMLSNGNIQDFEIISEIQIPDGGGFVTFLKATVSVTKLRSFVESKGGEVEFQGGLFGAMIKQQKLKEEAEYKAILNMVDVLYPILGKSLDYSVEVSEPVAYGEDFQLVYSVTVNPNDNYNLFLDYFTKNISSIAMSESEIESYEKLNKPTFALLLTDNQEFKGGDYFDHNLSDLTNEASIFVFRSFRSLHYLRFLFLTSNLQLTNFVVTTDIDTTQVNIGAQLTVDGYSQTKVFCSANVFASYGDIQENVWALNIEDKYDSRGIGTGIWTDRNVWKDQLNDVNGLGSMGYGYPDFYIMPYGEYDLRGAQSGWPIYSKELIFIDDHDLTLMFRDEGIYLDDEKDCHEIDEYPGAKAVFKEYLGDVWKKFYAYETWTFSDYYSLPSRDESGNIIDGNRMRDGQEIIGILSTSKRSYKHKFSAIYTLDEIMKISMVSIEKRFE
jgi:hypothetical protein